MRRARISTTVDATTLSSARQLFDGRDADLLDAALSQWLRDQIARSEREALLAAPYEADPELAPGDDESATPDLPYSGSPPPSVVRAARTRRRTR